MITQPVRRRSNPRNALVEFAPRPSGAANDNKRLRVVVPTSPRRLARHGAGIIRMNPFIRTIHDALSVLEPFSQSQPAGWDVSGTGWSICGQCASPNPIYSGDFGRISSTTAANGTVCNFANNCLSEQALSTSTIGNPFTGIGFATRTIGIGRVRPVGSTFRAQVQISFTRPNTGNPAPFPEYKQAKAAIALPQSRPEFWVITANPNVAPPLQAPAFTPPVPWRENPYWRAPNREVSNGRSNAKPSSVPNDFSFSIASGKNKPAPAKHKMEPPPKGVKETKHKLSTAEIAVLRTVGFVTEGVDFVDALYEALPNQYRPRYMGGRYEKLVTTPQERLAALIEYGEYIDIPRAIEALISNQIEDFVYGKIGKLGGQTSAILGKSYGTGLNVINKEISKWNYLSENSD